MQKSRTPPAIACPQCGKPSIFGAENPFRPFCGERCKLIDLGNWATERYRVPLAEGPDTPADQEDG